MKPSNCPNCDFSGDDRPKIRLNGSYYRTSDSCVVQRYKCTGCNKGFSDSTFHPCYWQKKRQKNFEVCKWLASGVSMRRIAINCNLHRITVARILEIEAMRCEFDLMVYNAKRPKSEVVQFDDLITFEHTKCKPLAVTLAVDEGSRRILGFEVSSMASNGPLAAKSKEKYGPRPDRTREGRRRLFKRIKMFVADGAIIQSDKNPYYPRDVKEFFPTCTHETFQGRRGASTGYQEMKKVGFDPLFTLNHTCAMLRDSIKRLARKTWCTTKRAGRLYAHLLVYSRFHNSSLIPQT